jgi:hypothetical protein
MLVWRAGFLSDAAWHYVYGMKVVVKQITVITVLK